MAVQIIAERLVHLFFIVELFTLEIRSHGEMRISSDDLVELCSLRGGAAQVTQTYNTAGHSKRMVKAQYRILENEGSYLNLVCPEASIANHD